ncbi:hypothetical protein GUJ93_ZPchr0013g37601 [Zizania palustris]|uniref:Uncharacterized protein n=1 Tax=Zizania palustris TaxID=103762 RepID=A0A8J5WVA4_ZIZPA|nr:hypothetical protein GUJ93_ZPchr0013g37601 [Zizania palustris]
MLKSMGLMALDVMSHCQWKSKRTRREEKTCCVWAACDSGFDTSTTGFDTAYFEASFDNYRLRTTQASSSTKQETALNNVEDDFLNSSQWPLSEGNLEAYLAEGIKRRTYEALEWAGCRKQVPSGNTRLVEGLDEEYISGASTVH